ncbi:MAG: hypothetical protein BWY73_00723 [candidate division TA06 bacterium ADurb.Bin417]|uniref:Uncharacterized protein n=1 Tax=candidate division TA06 bacterium ADurb.Bin417 TaxID=1852828 RepID=A0A1V5MIH9_UNCT6|nr:MAG: hypothetical protein BWY73_00723 [candidate division TA06 bacterium ADurb.Bin417]
MVAGEEEERDPVVEDVVALGAGDLRLEGFAIHFRELDVRQGVRLRAVALRLYEGAAQLARGVLGHEGAGEHLRRALHGCRVEAAEQEAQLGEPERGLRLAGVDEALVQPVVEEPLVPLQRLVRQNRAAEEDPLQQRRSLSLLPLLLQGLAPAVRRAHHGAGPAAGQLIPVLLEERPHLGGAVFGEQNAGPRGEHLDQGGVLRPALLGPGAGVQGRLRVLGGVEQTGHVEADFGPHPGAGLGTVS